VAFDAIASSFCDVETASPGAVHTKSMYEILPAWYHSWWLVYMYRSVWSCVGQNETLFCGERPAIRSGVRTESPATLAAGFSVDPECVLRLDKPPRRPLVLAQTQAKYEVLVPSRQRIAGYDSTIELLNGRDHHTLFAIL
jgi:hypothetical protein